MKHRINTGYSDFCELRRENCYYVDKTDFIEQFCEIRPAVGLFTRPRRFGKSLHLSMLRYFFDVTRKDTADCFAGLKITRNQSFCEEWMHQYPVLYLDFKSVSSAQNFFEAKIQILEKIRQSTRPFRQFLASMEHDDAETMEACWNRTMPAAQEVNILREITEILHNYFKKKVIILVDEYDIPTRTASENNYYSDLIPFVSALLSDALKDNSSLKFGILTGCLRISHESLFSGLNNFTCYDIFSYDFSETFGFTDSEVTQILEDFNISSKKDLIKKWYDGYVFGNETEIYSPWDISSYVGNLTRNPNMAPESYWTNTALTNVLHLFLKKDSGNLINALSLLLDGEYVKSKRDLRINYRNLYDLPDHIWLYLANAGYLTQATQSFILQKNIVHQNNEVILTIPNLEVQQALRDELKGYLENAANEVWIDTSLQPLLDAMIETFSKCDAEGFSQSLSALMLECISYHQYDEKFYQGFLGFLLKFSRHYTLLEEESGEGRADIIVVQGENIQTITCAAIIEVKKAPDDSQGSLEKAVEAALDQIELRKYDASFRLRNVPKIVHWGIAFQRKHCLAKARVVAQ